MTVDHQIKLNNQENQLLLILSKNLNQPVLKTCILKHLWKNEFFSEREFSLNNILWGLCKKLKDSGDIEIINIHKTGWKLILK